MSNYHNARRARATLFAACASAALLATPVYAQDNVQQDEVEEVIVTAQRRSERAQDVPVVVNVFSAERLEQLDINEAQDLYGTVPSLIVGNQGQNSRDMQEFSIRGQSRAYNSGPAVVTYVDEVPIQDAGSELYIDVQSIQVLSGPQGTLFGRNTTGGAVLFTTRKPTDEFEGYIEGGVGNYDLRSFEGAVNVPLVADKLMVRLSGAYQDRSGYTQDLVWNKDRDDKHWYSGRIGVLFTPTERLENYLTVYQARSSTNGTGHILRSFNIPTLTAINFCQEGPSIPFTIASCDVYRRQAEIADQIGPRQTRLNVDAFSKRESWGAINTTSYDLNDQLTIKNIMSYKRRKSNSAWDQDASPIQQHEVNQSAPHPNFPVPGLTDEFGLPLLGYTNAAGVPISVGGKQEITEELQLQGRLLDDKLNFTTGVFYFDDRSVGADMTASTIYCPAEFTGLCPITVSEGGGSSTSKAVFAQGTLDLGIFNPALDRLRFTAGARYTWDKLAGFDTRVGGSTTNFEKKDKAATWTVGLDYRPIEDLLVYGKASKGYKSGGYNGSSVRPGTEFFAPEELVTYEAGFKSDWRPGGVPVQLNGAYYYSDYDNIQRPTGDYNPVTNISGARYLEAEAVIQGFELQTLVRPYPGLELGASVSHTDPKYKKFEADVFTTTDACNGLVTPPPGGSALADFTCRPFSFTTDWQYNVFGSVDLPIPDQMGDMSLYVSYSHVGEQATSPMGGEPGSTLEAHGLLNASLTWSDVGGQEGVELTVFGNNLANKLYRVSNSNVLGSLLYHSELYGEPRMYGVKLRYSFGS